MTAIDHVLSTLMALAWPPIHFLIEWGFFLILTEIVKAAWPILLEYYEKLPLPWRVKFQKTCTLTYHLALLIGAWVVLIFVIYVIGRSLLYWLLAFPSLGATLHRWGLH